MNLKVIFVLAIIIIFVGMSLLVNTANYVAWAVQSITQQPEYEINNELKLSTPKDWIISDYYTEDTGHLLYGLIPYENEKGVSHRSKVYIKFTELASDNEVIIYQLKKKEIPENAYVQKKRIVIFDEIAGFVIRERNTRTIYFPNENMMIVGSTNNIENYFRYLGSE